MMNCRDYLYVMGKEKISVSDSGSGNSRKNSDLMEERISQEYFCEKVGGMPCLNGECHDAYQKKLEIMRHSGKMRLRKRERGRKNRRKTQEVRS